MWILPPTTSDCLKCTVQAKKIRAFVADNMFERFNSQTVTRPLMRFAVHLLVTRLGPHFHYSSNKSTVSAIIETVVVDRNLGGITSREDYIELRDASRDSRSRGCLLFKAAGDAPKELDGLSQKCERHGREILRVQRRRPHDRICQGARIWQGPQIASPVQDSPRIRDLL